MNTQTEDQRIAQRLAEESLWRVGNRACTRHLVSRCYCLECKTERFEVAEKNYRVARAELLKPDKRRQFRLVLIIGWIGLAVVLTIMIL